MKSIKINGKEYPYRMTMGGMLRFKEATGYDVSKIKDEITDVVRFMFCCCQSACSADGIEFTLTLEQFADNLTVEMLNEFKQENGQKKTKNPPLKP